MKAILAIGNIIPSEGYKFNRKHHTKLMQYLPLEKLPQVKAILAIFNTGPMTADGVDDSPRVDVLGRRNG